jgi:hypothetical protein
MYSFLCGSLYLKFYTCKALVRSIAISPDGRWIVSGSFDQMCVYLGHEMRDAALYAAGTWGFSAVG